MIAARSFTRIGRAVCIAAALLSGCGDDPADDAIRDVLFITVDTLRADRLGYAGHAGASTPHIDALAGAGTVFTQAITTMPRTTPGLASLFTGLWPHHHGSREVGDPIVTGLTLTEVLAEQGYYTVAVSANGVAGPEQGLGAGFDHFVTRRDLGDRYGERIHRDRTMTPEGDVGWAEATTDIALELVREAPADRPLFLWILYFDPHFIYRPPPPWQVEAKDCTELYAWGLANLRNAGQVFNDHDGVASAAVDDCAKLYDAEITYTDAEIGRLLEGLKGLRSLDDALTVFTADHGENLGEGGLYFEHGDNLHDAALRVPLVFSGPGIAEGRVDVGTVSLVDVASTVVSLLGLDPAALATDGVDLSERLRGGTDAAAEGSRRSAARDIRFAESATSLWNDAARHLTTGRAGSRACIHGPVMSLCRDPEDDGGAPRLYDRMADPLLTMDVADRHPEAVAELLAAWERWPPETARHLSARTSDFKLVRSPILEGGYRDALFDLKRDLAETTDVSARHPEVAAALTRALDAWAAPMRESPERIDDEARLEELRALGYVP